MSHRSDPIHRGRTRCGRNDHHRGHRHELKSRVDHVYPNRLG